MNNKRYIIEEIETGRFVSWVTESTGKIRYCKKPGTANYFLAATDAQKWTDSNGLHHSKFRVRAIENHMDSKTQRDALNKQESDNSQEP